MKSRDLRKKLLEKSQAFREIYLKRNLPLEISHMVIRERIKKGLTQSQLAELVGTKQSGIARTERGISYPDIQSLERIAIKLGKYLHIEFRDTETHIKTWENSPASHRVHISVPSAYFSSSSDFAINVPPAANKLPYVKKVHAK